MAEKQQDFESALKELEELVGKMESDSMGLEEMVAAFEKGQKLVKSCSDRLNEVERRIEVIKKNADGSAATTEPLPPLSE